jgi:amino-acid N-acetyltransferase
MSEFVLRRATIADVKPMQRLLSKAAQQGLLLPRSLSSLYTGIRELYVMSSSDGAEVAGCCALKIFWDDIAEIRSLVVREDLRGHGIGFRLVSACLDEARDYGIAKVFSLTYQNIFFGKLGFKEIEKEILPNKIFTDCIHCAKYPDDCDEIAMLMELV